MPQSAFACQRCNVPLNKTASLTNWSGKAALASASQRAAAYAMFATQNCRYRSLRLFVAVSVTLHAGNATLRREGAAQSPTCHHAKVQLGARVQNFADQTAVYVFICPFTTKAYHVAASVRGANVAGAGKWHGKKNKIVNAQTGKNVGA